HLPLLSAAVPSRRESHLCQFWPPGFAAITQGKTVHMYTHTTHTHSHTHTHTLIHTHTHTLPNSPLEKIHFSRSAEHTSELHSLPTCRSPDLCICTHIPHTHTHTHTHTLSYTHTHTLSRTLLWRKYTSADRQSTRQNSTLSLHVALPICAYVHTYHTHTLTHTHTHSHTHTHTHSPELSFGENTLQQIGRAHVRTPLSPYMSLSRSVHMYTHTTHTHSHTHTHTLIHTHTHTLPNSPLEKIHFS